MRRNILYIIVLIMLTLAACVPTPTPPPPTETPPKPIEYLVMKDCVTCSAPVWPDIDAQTGILGYLKNCDMAPIRQRVMQGDQLWLEVLVGDLRQFEPGMTGWVKFKPDKMYTEWRQP